MRILVVEDESPIRNFLRINLESECFVVDEAEDGEKGSYLARTNDYSLVVLDNIMPRKFGKEVCKEIREAGVNVPILMLSVKTNVDDKVVMLNAGADDYMTKPFSFDELIARIRCLLRRPAGFQADVIAHGSLSLDTGTHKVFFKEHDLHLTNKEFAILELMLKQIDQITTKGQILEYAWDINANPFSNTVEAHIFSLRQKLKDRKRKIIQNIPGRGYKLSSASL